LLVSCLRWDPVAASWNANGITRNQVFLGNSSTAPFVECQVDGPGIFVASEVPAGCDGIPLSSAVNDECGVCGGSNQACSGCDGHPNTGRSKLCSGHGSCSGNVCSCDPGHAGVMCQIFCDPVVNCSGHGVCAVSFQNLEMNSTVSCSCQSGYVPTFQRVNGTVGCVESLVSVEQIPKWAVITMSILATAFVLLIVGIVLLRSVSVVQT